MATELKQSLPRTGSMPLAAAAAAPVVVNADPVSVSARARSPASPHAQSPVAASARGRSPVPVVAQSPPPQIRSGSTRALPSAGTLGGYHDAAAAQSPVAKASAPAASPTNAGTSSSAKLATEGGLPFSSQNGKQMSSRVTARGNGYSGVAIGAVQFPVSARPALAEAFQQHPDNVKAFSHRRVSSDGETVRRWYEARAQQTTPPPSRPTSSAVSVTSPVVAARTPSHETAANALTRQQSAVAVHPNVAVRMDFQARLATRTLSALPGAGSKAPSKAVASQVAAPPEATGWTQLEMMLFRQSEGQYHPGDMAKQRRVPNAALQGRTGSELQVQGRVSIVSPSMDTRQHYHENLWACFEAQTWPDKELIVIETYQNQPSEFLSKKAAEDSRLVHVRMQRPAGKDFTVGLKRNMTLHMASGEFVVNFDDDDLYASNYVESMVADMKGKNLEAVTLSAWYNYFAGQGVCTHSDPDGWEEWAESQEELDNILYGYGFSYAHRRQCSLQYPYPNVGFAEDAPFMLKLKEVFGTHKVGLKRDQEGICMHIMHRANTAQILDVSKVESHEFGRLAVASLAPFRQQIDKDFSWWSPWKPDLGKPNGESKPWGFMSLVGDSLGAKAQPATGER